MGTESRAEVWLVALNRQVVVVLIGVMATLVFANVVSRYVFAYSIIWVEELTRYMMVWVGFLGAGLVLRHGAHIAVDVFQDMLPPPLARAARVVVVLLLGATFAATTFLGVQYVRFAWDQETPVLNWNFGLVYIAIPVGSALLLVHLGLIARRYVAAREFVKDKDFGAEDATL